MRLYTFEHNGAQRIGAEQDGRLVDLVAASSGALPGDMLNFIRGGAAARQEGGQDDEPGGGHGGRTSRANGRGCPNRFHRLVRPAPLRGGLHPAETTPDPDRTMTRFGTTRTSFPDGRPE